MANQGTPTAGLEEIARRVFVDGDSYSLLAYTNTQGSLGPATVRSDLVEPTAANGYAEIILNGTWDPTDGIAAYTHSGGASDDGSGNPCWYPTAAWSAAVTGVAIVTGTTVQHFMDLKDGDGNLTTFTAAAGKKLAVSIAQLASS